MSENAMIQSKAKSMLSGMWGPAAIATLIIVALSSVASFTYIVPLLIAGPLGVGYVLFLMKLVDFRVADYNSLFSGFTSNFGNNLVAGLLKTLIEAIGCALLIVPGIIASLGLGMTYFIMAENPDISGTDALRQSWEMMKGHKWELFCLYCRFIGWILLCILTVGILTLWINPWMEVSVLNFYRKLKYQSY